VLVAASTSLYGGDTDRPRPLCARIGDERPPWRIVSARVRLQNPDYSTNLVLLTSRPGRPSLARFIHRRKGLRSVSQKKHEATWPGHAASGNWEPSHLSSISTLTLTACWWSGGDRRPQPLLACWKKNPIMTSLSRIHLAHTNSIYFTGKKNIRN
jgi:hypothetical protein